MFGSITDRYDAFNHVSTLGQDLLWRPRAIWELARVVRGPVRQVLDVGCGPGELARGFAGQFPGARVVAVDFSPVMVRSARSQGPGAPGPARLRFGVANIARLPFSAGSFDVAASAFVARNLKDLGACFRELRRVLRPGGTLLTLEVSEPASPLIGRLFHAHFDRLVPLIGRAFDREGPYSYLPESLRFFPSRERLLDLLRESGFPRTKLYPMSLGVVTAYFSEASAAPDGSP